MTPVVSSVVEEALFIYRDTAEGHIVGIFVGTCIAATSCRKWNADSRLMYMRSSGPRRSASACSCSRMTALPPLGFSARSGFLALRLGFRVFYDNVCFFVKCMFFSA